MFIIYVHIIPVAINILMKSLYRIFFKMKTWLWIWFAAPSKPSIIGSSLMWKLLTYEQCTLKTFLWRHRFIRKSWTCFSQGPATQTRLRCCCTYTTLIPLVRFSGIYLQKAWALWTFIYFLSPEDFTPSVRDEASFDFRFQETQNSMRN